MTRPASVAQSGNQAERDVVVGNVNNFYQQPISTLKQLADRLKLDADDSADGGEFLEELQHFKKNHPADPPRDLETKLQESGRESVSFEATLWKEQFCKKLMRFQLSPQAREIFVHILGKIHSYFIAKVRPAIEEGSSRSEVDGLVYELVTEIYNDVGSSPLRLTQTDVHGMVFFLAGNCHIDWK